MRGISIQCACCVNFYCYRIFDWNWMSAGMAEWKPSLLSCSYHLWTSWMFGKQSHTQTDCAALYCLFGLEVVKGVGWRLEAKIKLSNVWFKKNKNPYKIRWREGFLFVFSRRLDCVRRLRWDVVGGGLWWRGEERGCQAEGLVLVRARIRFLPKMSPTLCHLFQEHKATFIAGGR